MTGRTDDSISRRSAFALNMPPSQAKCRTVTVPSVGRCMLTILALKLIVKVFGLWRTLCWIDRGAEKATILSTGHVATVHATEHAVATAAAFYPGRALCLEQSLALYFVLRRQGVPVAYCQGVQAQPFQAHAWVEYEGEPVNDIPERVRRFARFHH